MGICLLYFLGLGLALAGPSENRIKIIKEEFVTEEMPCVIVKIGQAKHPVEVLMNLTLLDKNISLSILKAVMSSSLLTIKGISYSIPKGNNSLGNDKEYSNGMMVWRKILGANVSCRLSNDFIHGFMEVLHKVPKVPIWKSGQNPASSCGESPELQNGMCKVTTSKLFPRCQYHSVTSLKKMLTVLTSHSLMSWLVSGSKL